MAALRISPEVRLADAWVHDSFPASESVAAPHIMASPKKTALITGAGRGLGRSLALTAATAGYTVYAGVRSESAAADLAGFAGVRPVALDVTHREQRAGCLEKIASETGAIDLLIHNAGVNSSSSMFGEPQTQVRFGSLTEEALAGTACINAIAPLLLTQEAAPLLAASARVIAISSWFASIEESGSRDFNFGYTGSKAILNAYFRLAANALRPRGVITLIVNPGWMRTDMGGQRATRSPDESAADILRLAAGADETMSGTFVDCDGTPHSW